VLSGTVILRQSWETSGTLFSVILKRSSVHFTAGDQFDSGRGNGILQRTLGDNWCYCDGERHKHQRQLLMPPFHGERMRAYGELICQITEQVTSQWQATQSFAVRPCRKFAARDFASRGFRAGQRYDQIKQLIGKFLDLTATRRIHPSAVSDAPKLGSWSPGGRFNRLRQEIDDLLYRNSSATGDPN